MCTVEVGRKEEGEGEGRKRVRRGERRGERTEGGGERRGRRKNEAEINFPPGAHAKIEPVAESPPSCGGHVTPMP
jgi:hypothetical protein